MTSPVNLPTSTAAHGVKTSDNQASQGRRKRSASIGSGSGLVPEYSAEVIQAAPTLHSNNADEISARPTKRARRGAMSVSSPSNPDHLQPTQSGVDRMAEDAADSFSNISLKNQGLKKPKEQN